MLLAAILGAAACAPPLALDTGSIIRSATAAAPADETAEAPAAPMVQLRYFSFSPEVSVVAWSPDDAAYGLRGWIRRDGSLISDHRLYVRTYYQSGIRAFPQALAASQPLLTTGTSRDYYACWMRRPCSPSETFGARIPDDVLRAASDSLSVTFYANTGEALVVTLRSELISAYLAAVDAASAQLRLRAQPARPARG